VLFSKLLLTREEAAEFIGFSLRKIDQLVAAGELKPRRIGESVRFSVSELVRFASIEVNGDHIEEGGHDHEA
jgi:excisionase family DNA binding protein